MKSVCVFCGSNVGSKQEYIIGAQEMGNVLSKQSIKLIYGGGDVGLMGKIADAVLSCRGEVIGVIPDFLMKKEVGHKGLTHMHVVQNMHQRKQLMADLSDAFIAMPGGIGTLEELFEVFTWGQLGLHQKPIGLLNIAGFYDPLIDMLNHMVLEKFIRQENLDMLFIDSDPLKLIAALKTFEPQKVEKWMDRNQS